MGRYAMIQAQMNMVYMVFSIDRRARGTMSSDVGLRSSGNNGSLSLCWLLCFFRFCHLTPSATANCLRLTFSFLITWNNNFELFSIVAGHGVLPIRIVNWWIDFRRLLFVMFCRYTHKTCVRPLCAVRERDTQQKMRYRIYYIFCVGAVSTILLAISISWHSAHHCNLVAALYGLYA